MPDPVVQPEQPAAPQEAVRLNRPLGDEEFKAKLEMTKAFCDTAKSYVQLSSAGLALPLLFTEAIFGKAESETGLLGSPLWELIASWGFFLIAIASGLVSSTSGCP